MLHSYETKGKIKRVLEDVWINLGVEFVRLMSLDYLFGFIVLMISDDHDLKYLEGVTSVRLISKSAPLYMHWGSV